MSGVARRRLMPCSSRLVFSPPCSNPVSWTWTRRAAIGLAFGAIALVSASARAHGVVLNPFGPDRAHAHHHGAHRAGGVASVLLGASMCIPGRAACSRDAGSGAVSVDGRTRPSFGMAAELGFRFNPYVSAGVHYTLAFLDADYEVEGASDYERVFVHGVYGVVRPTLPRGRVDFSLGLGAGFARQVLRRSDSQRDYADGFSALLSPGIDVFVSSRVFVGASADVLLNAPRRTCHEDGDATTCARASSLDAIPIHNTVFGLRVGGTFL